MVQAGTSVVLQAPTGAGKTRAALAPFIEGFFDLPPEAFARKCIYVVPMRVLAQQFVVEYGKHAERFERIHGRRLRVAIQTGDRPEDRRFEADLVFCTVDQFLSNYFTMPYSLPERLANLNAGAMAGAYIVCDEFHLLDPDSTLPSVLHACRHLRSLAPVTLMTATLSSDMLRTLSQWLDAEIVTVPPEEMGAIEARAAETTRRRVWRIAESELTARSVLQAHRSRSLALCNTVLRAQGLYRDLKALVAREHRHIDILLLHSRFLADDRRRIEDELRARFGPDRDQNGSVIAVATQAIEVGVDISSDVLHTELAPASSLIQRAGRCARFAGEQGEVVVYPVTTYAPYGRESTTGAETSAWVTEMKAAWRWLADHSGETMDSGQEQALVEAVAASRDRMVIEAIRDGQPARREAIHRVLRGDRHAGDSRLLVRNADSRTVLVHPDPDELLGAPYSAAGFSISRQALYGMFRDWMERDVDLDWRVMRLIDAPVGDDDAVEYGWQPLYEASLLSGVRVLAVNPELAGYLPDEGFVSDRGGSGFCSSTRADTIESSWERPSYRLEAYSDHVRRVVDAFSDICLPELRFAAPALERAAGWPDGSVTRAAWLVCLLHDTGKLSRRWQRWAHAYQERIGQPVPQDLSIAHTTSDPANPAHQDAAREVRRRYPKPSHAGESALAVGPILVEALDRIEPLARAALTAIARHHAPFAERGRAYSLRDRGVDALRSTLVFLPEEVLRYVSPSRLKREVAQEQAVALVVPEDSWGWQAYALLARALRRADQEGTARGSKEGWDCTQNDI